MHHPPKYASLISSDRRILTYKLSSNTNDVPMVWKSDY